MYSSKKRKLNEYLPNNRNSITEYDTSHKKIKIVIPSLLLVKYIIEDNTNEAEPLINLLQEEVKRCNIWYYQQNCIYLTSLLNQCCSDVMRIMLIIAGAKSHSSSKKIYGLKINMAFKISDELEDKFTYVKNKLNYEIQTSSFCVKYLNKKTCSDVTNIILSFQPLSKSYLIEKLLKNYAENIR
jgi:hypothetical protein